MRQTEDRQKPEPTRNWAPVYLLFIGALGLMYLERRSAMSRFDHTTVLLGTLLLFFVLLSWWLDVQERK